MFLTKRETILLTELMNSNSPVSMDRMMQLLKVSKRTVYRELANLENSLRTVGASLEKEGRGHFESLSGIVSLSCKKQLCLIHPKSLRQ